jgi:hypothetical protein
MAYITQFSEQDISHFVVNSPEKAYTLGFMWGDAHLTRYKIKTGQSNIHYPKLEIVRDDLLVIKDLFSVWGDWICRFRSRPNRRPQGEIALFDSSFGWFLAQHDYLIKSISEPTKILSVIPKELKQYWWRGFIDADGCFYLNKRWSTNQFSIAGSFALTWDETIKMFSQLDIDKYQVQHRLNTKSSNSVIRISNPNSIVKLGNYIYANNLHIGLQRKYDKYALIKNSITHR